LERLRRVSDGNINSGVDEFLSRRIPLQFGGMTDPFSSLESKHRTALDHLEVLAKYKYPTLVSTKSDAIVEPAYVDQFLAGNFLIRFSVSVVRSATRGRIEKGTPSSSVIFRTIERLAHLGIDCAVRFQPVIPGHECVAFELVRDAARAGARHVTFEYLKLPIDDLDSPICQLPGLAGETLLNFYRRSGSTIQGRELVLPAHYKTAFLSEIGSFARQLRLSVGFGDNEFLPYSDGNSCCNGADLYLKGLNLFQANPASLIRRTKKGDEIVFDDLLKEWQPKSNIGSYLNSRVRTKSTVQSDWRNQLERQWSPGAIYAPDFFHGVEGTGTNDRVGRPIFVRTQDRL